MGPLVSDWKRKKKGGFYSAGTGFELGSIWDAREQRTSWAAIGSCSEGGDRSISAIYVAVI